MVILMITGITKANFVLFDTEQMTVDYFYKIGTLYARIEKSQLDNIKKIREAEAIKKEKTELSDSQVDEQAAIEALIARFDKQGVKDIADAEKERVKSCIYWWIRQVNIWLYR